MASLSFKDILLECLLFVSDEKGQKVILQDRWTDERTVGRTDRRTDGRTDRRTTSLRELEYVHF